ncbi:MAG: hypothetical protein U0235_04225 [Polyangiaceae bacterium]
MAASRRQLVPWSAVLDVPIGGEAPGIARVTFGPELLVGPSVAFPRHAPLRLLMGLVDVLVVAPLRVGRADPAPCVPPFCVQIETPPVRVQTPTIDPRIEVEARARAAPRPARLREPMPIAPRRVRGPRARVGGVARLLRVGREASRAGGAGRARASRRPPRSEAQRLDRFAFVPPPVSPPPSFPGLHDAAGRVGVVPLCVGLWSGEHAPVHAGFCPNVRLRIDPSWSLTLDPSFTWQWSDRRGDATLGLSPGVAYSMLLGQGAPGPRAPLRDGGLDSWVPLGRGSRPIPICSSVHMPAWARPFRTTPTGASPPRFAGSFAQG